MRIAFTTLGCKINQYETDQLCRKFISKGNIIVPFDSEADIYIINTCSVTAKSDYHCRQVIKSAAKRGQAARVIVTGCYASTRPEEVRNIPGVDLVVDNSDKLTIADQIMNSDANPAAYHKPVEITSINKFIPLFRPDPNNGTKTLNSRTRGFLKIQDGCDNRCSYCIVPFARGGSRSTELVDVIRQFDQLIEAGYPEVVLTGIHIGTYGIDITPRTNLTELLFTLVSRRGKARIRLSSIEPNEITSGIIDLLGKGVCRHLHIPLQSGDDSILSAMGRNYTSSFYLEQLNRISDRIPGIALGADIMVGFPGEGDKEFLNTLDLVERSPLSHLHIFSYSPRPGTLAAEMKKQVPKSVKNERNAALRALGSKKNMNFRLNSLGLELKIVVEDKRNERTGMLTGLSDNYIRMAVSGIKEEHIGKTVDVRLEKIEKEENLALIL